MPASRSPVPPPGDVPDARAADLRDGVTQGPAGPAAPAAPVEADPAMAGQPDSLTIGQTIGSYRVVRKLGEGGMGSVFAAEHQHIGYRAAIKVLHAEFSRHQEIARRFLNEARAVNIIQHPAVVKIFDFGRLPDRTAFIIMEFLDGEALHKRVDKSGGRLPLGVALRITRQLASALGAAHQRNIVHRDLKPANVILVADPEAEGGERAKILDFGLAKVAAEVGDTGSTHLKTRTGVVMGTAMYMAPEQCRGARDVDGKVDVYSLGVMLYELLAARPPFVAASEGELVTMHLRDQPPPLLDLVPALPARIAPLVHRMLAKLPADRPTMAEVESELLDLCAHYRREADGGREAGASAQPPGATLPQHSLKLAGLLGLAVCGLVTLGWLLARPTLLPEAGRPQRHVAFNKVPLNTKYHLRAVWQMAPGNMWIVGDSGTILHYNGSGWSPVPSETTQSLRSLWGAQADDIWVVGGHGTILHWNGVGWNAEPSPTTVDLRGVYGTSPRDIWAVGKQGTLLHYRGDGWTRVPSGVSEDMRSVWGSGLSDLWAVGEYGIILHWDGTAWAKSDSGTTSWLQCVWGDGPGNVWVVGNESTLLHWDGRAWSSLKSDDPPTELSAVWGTGPGEVWAAGNEGTVLHWDGKTWSSVQSGVNNWLYGMWGTAPDDIWAVGAYGALLHHAKR